MQTEVICQDVLDWAASYDGPKYHALLCDPPYELAFMGKDWDKSGIAFNPDTWAALAEHLHPGAFGMAFASARGWHRLACAIEDAGLRIHPSIFGWAQGSGFPKATRIDTQIDKAAGAEREVVGEKWVTNSAKAQQDGYSRIGGKDGYASGKAVPGNIPITAPATPLAQAWAGHRYGLQALKPALEPIIVFQKPYEGKPVDSIVETGAGALNIEQARVGTDQRPLRSKDADLPSNGIYGEGLNGSHAAGTTTQGRWPANLVLTHLPGCERVGVKRVDGTCKPYERNEVADSDKYGAGCGTKDQGYQVTGYADPDGKETVTDWRCEDGCPVKRLGEMSGERSGFSGFQDGAIRKVSKGKGGYHGNFPDRLTTKGHNDTGTAARFYYQASWQYEIAERLADADPVRYVAKAARRERDAGLENFGLQPVAESDGRQRSLNGKERIEDGQVTGPRNAPTKARNPHPTVKPIALGIWLARLLAPPPEYVPRRLLVPFAGSGSEMCAAGLSGGWEEITGIEFDAATCAIAEARLEHWLNRVQMELF